MRFRHLLIVAALFFGGPEALAQNYPDIHWKTIQTAHFIIHYYDEVKSIAQKVAVIAENESYPKVTAIYRHEPKNRTHIIIRDDDDRSNGFAVFNLGWITIWTSPANLPLRGWRDWIRGVVTHEFAHIVSLQASSPTGWLIEGLRFGVNQNLETNANTDVGGTVFLPTHTYPRWWAEGTAQLDSTLAGVDAWDPNRDMLLRAATLENNLLTFDQMRNITVREHLGGEMVYNQGYNFLLWLNEKYAKNVNVEIAKDSATRWRLDFDTHYEKVLGKSGKELYEEWKKDLQAKYEKQVEEIRKAPVEGNRIPLLSKKELAQEGEKDRPYADGAYNFYSRFSPDGRWFSWVNRGTLHLRYLDIPFALPNLDSAEKKSKPIHLEFPGSVYSWAPNSNKLVISRRRSDVFGGYPYYDLYEVTLPAKEKLKEDSPSPSRKTHGLRATQVAWSPDGKKIAYVQTREGGRQLRLLDPDYKKSTNLVSLGGDAEATDPAWSPDGKKIAFTLFNHDQADIWIVDVATKEFHPVTLDAYDDRDPIFTPDGKSIYFSSDRSGIFQIYSLSVTEPSAKPVAVTQVDTGAFQPFLTAGTPSLIYTKFSSYGYKPYLLHLSEPPASPLPDRSVEAPAKTEAEQKAAETFPEISGSSYFPWPRPARLFPTLIFEDSQFKAGIATQISDYLEKHTLTATALFGEDQDYQLAYQNRMFYPTINASYNSYVRSSTFDRVRIGTPAPDDPLEVVHDNIQFVQAGLSQQLHFKEILEGDHTIGLYYNRRFVDTRLGFPQFSGNKLTTEFRRLTNDSATLSWEYTLKPGISERDDDINPQGRTEISASYALTHTGLIAPDHEIPQKYFYHEGNVMFAKYMSVPWFNHHTFWFQFNGGIKSRNVNINDEFFLGGRLNFRAFGQISANTLFYGYEDFSISGETQLLLSTGYTYPILREIDRKIGYFYFDSLYGSFFVETGNAWDFGSYRNASNQEILLEDMGAELRLKSFLFTDFNDWNSILRVAYGFQDDAAHGFSDSDNPLRIFIGIGTNF